ncbi:MAG: hypothetical protein AVDCRST_MAG93-6292 [uncultured Chloroflexia bacterium]|uniref:Uncharacterized protein n=1 Tax=uncultured Chloroflexia bacterium TaxID=1672391 RepID=A0A6J4LHK7_9CHLR|nr:MAG: hypothetical protein AVDCRST_MAG93-6292 [uncultured Chloroflexia bacterium]
MDIPAFSEFYLVGSRTAWVDIHNNPGSPRIDALDDTYLVARVESERHNHEIIICTEHTRPSFGSMATNNVLLLLF